MSTVLVTGGSGFVGSHIVLQLLAAGHRVRTTVRSQKREAEARAMLKEGGAEHTHRLTFLVADLAEGGGWASAVAGCDYVVHVASPSPLGVPKFDDEWMLPAREGSLRVLRAARAAGVKRVVLTSSFAAMGYGQPPLGDFTEEDWTPGNGTINAYVKSKTLVERDAWAFVGGEGRGLELAVINPVGVFGPVLGPTRSSSIGLVRALLEGGIPGCPRLYFGVVDVRDVADLHLRAMTSPAANRQRFLAVAGDFVSMRDIALTLKAQLGYPARKVPTRRLPDLVVRAAAIFDPAVQQVLPELGRKKSASSEKARRLLGWAPRPGADSLMATAESLLRLGLIRGVRGA